MFSALINNCTVYKMAVNSDFESSNFFQEAEYRPLGVTTSTNVVALEWMVNDAPAEGSLVTASFQTNGKGQEGNVWESEKDANITVSVILYPKSVKPEDQFYLTQIISLSVCDIIEMYLPDEKTYIKWPNDIYAGNRKIAGILIQNQIMGDTISGCIAGLGLNVNQASFSAAAPRAISMRMISGNIYNLKQLLSDWHNFVGRRYRHLQNKETEQLNKEYLSRLYLRGVKSGYIIRGREMNATITGLAPFGMLKLHDEKGNEIVCAMKEIVFTE